MGVLWLPLGLALVLALVGLFFSWKAVGGSRAGGSRLFLDFLVFWGWGWGFSLFIIVFLGFLSFSRFLSVFLGFPGFSSGVGVGLGQKEMFRVV